MNGKKFQVVLIVVLMALFASVVPVLAYPADIPDPAPNDPAPEAAACSAALTQYTQVDIPSRRADYALMDTLSSCRVFPSVSTGGIPVTGSADRIQERFEWFKMRQAEDNSH